MTSMEVVRISDIDRSSRHRKSLGELSTLCQSIEAVGLLHPVVITKERKLVAGARRIAAYERLGKADIPATIVSDMDDAILLLRAEQDENTCRLDFSAKEAVEVGRALEELERPKAEERKKQKEGGKQGEKVSVGNFPQEKGRTADKVGDAVGMSGRTYQAAKMVVAAAEEDPETFKQIADDMDATGRVWPAYEKVREIKKNGTRSEATPQKSTNGKTPVGVLRANEAIDCLKRIPKNDAHRKRGFQIVTDWIRHNK